jgi:hypothetical protein
VATASPSQTLTKKEIIHAALDADPTLDADRLAELAGCDVGHAGRERKAWAKAREAGTVETIPIDAIVLDDSTQMRPAVNPDRTAELAELAAGGVELRPIDVVRLPDGTHRVTDGWHRLDVAMSAGAETIAARVKVGTLDDAIEEAARANSDGPMPRCDQTKRNAIAALLRLPKYANAPDREIQKAAGVSYLFARKVIDELTANTPPPTNGHAPDPLAANLAARAASDTRTVTRNGKTYEVAARKPPNPAPESEPATNGHLLARADAPDDDARAPDRTPPPKADPWEPTPQEREVIDESTTARQLAGPQLASFVRGVAVYFRTAETRKAFGDTFRHHSTAPPPGQPVDNYSHKIDAALRLNHPRHWSLCISCHGNGCSSCGRNGWHAS